MNTHSIGNHPLGQNTLAANEIDLLSLDVPYVADPTELYFSVCGDRPHNLLLESAEVDSKQDLKKLNARRCGSAYCLPW